MSWRGFEKRVKFTDLRARHRALITAMPRIACKASTNGALQAPFRIHDGIDIVLKCDLLSGMVEGRSHRR
ncbi:hypothetical protein BAE39_00100 [Mesorhizobium loti]|uniref:Uncharacterized protein n=1 Tax=Rhizobium loti TaxID=381 RepID=A0A1A5K108_RHILI|nr:hypothetical protein A9174_33060 [Mesorhizobium loti NZP2037]OBP78548.1 hypothetical protein BAE41_30395 [Mesorhizobium loti]OBP82041.1 hypothetical protein BAE39_00100 [Mesorhizobium loti]OBP97348.1 hypothetical protein BAE38_00110 [Mesorhizobium loti]OBQ59010.1 hypothetical protein A8145_25440 [Mesorhizobium loti]